MRFQWITSMVLAGAMGLSAHGEVSTAAMQKVSLDGVIDQDNDDTLAFTPDGNTVFFDTRVYSSTDCVPCLRLCSC